MQRTRKEKTMKLRSRARKSTKSWKRKGFIVKKNASMRLMRSITVRKKKESMQSARDVINGANFTKRRKALMKVNTK